MTNTPFPYHPDFNRTWLRPGTAVEVLHDDGTLSLGTVVGGSSVYGVYSVKYDNKTFSGGVKWYSCSIWYGPKVAA